MKEKNRNRFVSLAIMLIYILSFNSPLYAQTPTIDIEAPIYMNKSIVDNKTKVLLEDTFTINYKFQPQDIPADNILPESYLIQKEIVLVIDSSGSMAWDVNGNTIDDDGYWGDYYEIPKSQYIENHSAYKKVVDAEVGENDSWDERIEVEVERWEDYDFYRTYYSYYHGYYRIYYKYHYYQYSYYKRDWINTPALSRMELAKNSARNFLEQLEGMSNVKVGIVEYDSDTSIKYRNGQALLSVDNASDFQFLLDEIDDLQANGGTNIGKGMYKGFKLLESGSPDAEKYFIFLTDGAPTYYTYYDTDNDNKKDDNESYYLSEISGKTPKLGGTGSSDPYDRSLNYGKAVGQLMRASTMDMESYFVAFADDDAANRLGSISDEANGHYMAAMTGNALETIYDELGEQISSDISIKNIYFEETFPSAFDIVSFPSNMTKTGNTVKGSFGSINYNLNEEGTFFTAGAKDFTITLRAKAVGEHTLGSNESSYIRYEDLNGFIKIKPFVELGISVYEELPPEFTAHLSNSEADLTKFNLTIDLEEDSNLVILDHNNNVLNSNPQATAGIHTYTLTEEQLVGKYLNIKATDQFNNTSIESVPIIDIISFEDLQFSDLLVETQLNSTVNSLIVNNEVVDQNKLTNDIGQYSKEVNLIEGHNLLEIKVTNTFGNDSNLYFTNDLALDDVKPIITPYYSPKFVIKNDGYLTLTVFVESNGTGSEIVETHFVKLPEGVTTADVTTFDGIIGGTTDLMTAMTSDEIDAIGDFADNKDHVEFKHEKFIVQTNGNYAIYARDRGGNEEVEVIKINNFIETLPELM